MGSEVGRGHYRRDDFQRFSARLKEETELLRRWMQEGSLDQGAPRAGFELEAWLVDANGRPAPRNAALLERLDDPLVVHELAQFNMELNGPARLLAEQPFSGLERDLSGLWQRCCRVGADLDAHPVMIGILPSVGPEDLSMRRISAPRRYRALNEQVLALRGGRPFRIDIRRGGQSLAIERRNVMLEAAATSLQLHLQLTPDNAARCFNTAIACSAATVAVAANAPMLFGRQLWEDTRIPLFQQAVAVDPVAGSRESRLQRVTFGTGYARDGLYPLFVENRQHYPVLLPECSDQPPERLAHLSLHNGTIWRWNRPLVGFDSQGNCHLRLEHRVMSAGPSVVDVVANAAFFHGLVQAGLRRDPPLEAGLPFATAERNFYAAARDGLDARVEWLGGHSGPLRELILEQLLPMAEEGLRRLDLPEREYHPWLEVLEGRVRTGRTGAAWQKAWVERHGPAMEALVNDYRQRQQEGAPVHQWGL